MFIVSEIYCSLEIHLLQNRSFPFIHKLSFHYHISCIFSGFFNFGIFGRDPAAGQCKFDFNLLGVAGDEDSCPGLSILDILL